MLQIQAGPPLVRTRHAAKTYASQSAVSFRERKGRALSSQMSDVSAVRYQGSQKFLSPEELFQVYRISVDVRACVDRTAMEISTWNHGAEPAVDPTHDLYDTALDLAEEVNRFLLAPSKDDTCKTWQMWLQKLIRDLMNYDAMAAELVDRPDGTLEEVAPVHGGYVQPVIDKHGRLLYYDQTIPGSTEPVRWDPDQLLYMNLFPNTSYPGGTPIIECVVNEIMTRLRASNHVLLAYDADEIPPGVLLIAGLGGKAAMRLEDSLVNAKGADHKLRVFTNDNPKPMSANWIEMRHTPKDLDMKEVLKEVKRDIWRGFGRMPVTMGDTEGVNRSNSEVQDELGESQLIRPILEQVQALINMRLIPRIIGDNDLAALVHWSFEGIEGKGATPEELKTESESFAIDLEHGALTFNEWREAKGRLPIDGGDILVIKTSSGYQTVQSMIESATEEGEEEPDDGQEPEAAGPDEDEEAPGEVVAGYMPIPVHRARHRAEGRSGRIRLPENRSRAFWGHLDAHNGCSCEPRVAFRQADDLLPSDWQPEGRFRGARTMDLSALGRAIIDYKRRVSPLYRRARIDVLSAFRARLEDDGRLDAQEAINLQQRVGFILDSFAEKWRSTTEPQYRRAARVGRDAATEVTKAPSAEDWREMADAYHGQAMGFLVGTRGLVSDLKAQLATLISASVRGTRDEMTVRALRLRQGEEEIAAGAILVAAAAVFGRNEHRVDNWTGRLVDLANQVMARGVEDSAPTTTDDDGNEVPDTWMVSWEAAGDERTCPTCDDQSARGFFPVQELNIHPGGDTECRARCRCVLVYWLRSEVEAGTARRF